MRVEARDGPYRLAAEVIPMGSDLCVAITGGQGHVGCACLGLAHPGIGDPSLPGATVSAINAPRHRDGELAAGICKRLCAACGRTVAVVCGVHYDGLTRDDIGRIAALGDRLAEEILRRLPAR